MNDWFSRRTAIDLQHWNYIQMKNIIPISLLLLCANCTGKGNSNGSDSTMQSPDSIEMVGNEMKFKPGNTIKTRYELPKGFHRVKTDEGTFEHYLQNLPLKPQGYLTHLYDGTEKEKKVSTSVIDLDIDTLDIQHSAASIIRLWAEYLYSSGQFDKIHFNFKNGFQCDYSKWAQGFRIKQDGSRTRWYKAGDEEDYSYESFREYLRIVFRNTDSHSLAKEMKDATPEEFGIGTVIFNSRPPYNAAIVVDKIQKDKYEQSWDDTAVVLLAQGGDPAQEIEIIKGNGDELGLFHENGNHRPNSSTWTTGCIGEKMINVQGGRLLTDDMTFYGKKNKKFR